MDDETDDGGEKGRERSIALIRTMAAPFRVIDWVVIDPGDDPYAAFCAFCDDESFERVRRRDSANAEAMFVTIREPPCNVDFDLAADMLADEVNQAALGPVQVGLGYLRVPESCAA